MRKYYIFSYEAGLTTTTGFAGYHGRFSIAGYLAIFSTKEKAVDHMNRMTSSEPDKKHILMSKAKARKHFLGNSMEEFNYLIENNIDLNVPEEEEEEEIEEEEEPDFDVIKENTIATFRFLTCDYIKKGFDKRYTGHIKQEGSTDEHEAVMSQTTDPYSYPIAYFSKEKNTKEGLINPIISSFINERMRIINTNQQDVFYLEQGVAGDFNYIKVESRFK